MGKLFDELKEMKSQYDKKLKRDGKKAVREAFKELFDAHPTVKSITWTQYTPYFCDGEACHFSVGEFHVLLDSDEVADEEDEDYYDRWDKDPALKKLGKELEKLEAELPEDVMESVFGDHVKVVATPKGFSVVEYKHE